METTPVSSLSLQHDWHDLNTDSAWVSCSAPNQPTKYGNIELPNISSSGQTVVADGFEVKRIDRRSLRVHCAEYARTSRFIAPVAEFTNVHKKAVRCVDVSPEGNLAVSCADDQSLCLWQTDNGSVRRQLEGHVNDVTTCQFFPSGSVILSGGMDMQLRIWSAEDGSCPVTLVGHRGGITDTLIIDRGRNIVSCSRDGTSKLWDCGTAARLDDLFSCAGAINCSAMSAVPAVVTTGTTVGAGRSDRECGTDGKLLVLGREDGYLEAVALENRTNIFSLECQSAVNSCCFVDEYNVIAGLEDAQVVCYDVRNTSTHLWRFGCGTSPVNSVRSFTGSRIAICQGNGTCLVARTDLGGEQENIQLSGPDCDPLYDVAVHENTIYTSCRDGTIRKYSLKEEHEQ